MKKGGLGKKFEEVLENCFNNVPNVQFLRIHDQTTHYKGSTNPCDFLAYHKPYLYALEAKSVHSNTFPFSNVTDFQWKSLLEMSTIKGVKAGVIIWFVMHDETVFLNIKLLQRLKEAGRKSVHSYPDWLEYVESSDDFAYLDGYKKRTYFDYDMQQFLRDMEGTK